MPVGLFKKPEVFEFKHIDFEHPQVLIQTHFTAPNTG